MSKNEIVVTEVILRKGVVDMQCNGVPVRFLKLAPIEGIWIDGVAFWKEDWTEEMAECAILARKIISAHQETQAATERIQKEQIANSLKRKPE